MDVTKYFDRTLLLSDSNIECKITRVFKTDESNLLLRFTLPITEEHKLSSKEFQYLSACSEFPELFHFSANMFYRGNLIRLSPCKVIEFQHKPLIRNTALSRTHIGMEVELNLESVDSTLSFEQFSFTF